MAALVANHLALLIGMWPRSRLLGDNMRHCPDAAARRGEIAITFDDCPHPQVTPKVLDIPRPLRRQGEFLLRRREARRPPRSSRRRQGNRQTRPRHREPSMRHSVSSAFLRTGGAAKEIGAAQDPCSVALPGVRRVFRAQGHQNPMLDPVVARMGLDGVSWGPARFRHGRPRSAVVLERLTDRPVSRGHSPTARPPDGARRADRTNRVALRCWQDSAAA